MLGVFLHAGSKCSSLYALSSLPVYTSTTQKVSVFSIALVSW